MIPPPAAPAAAPRESLYQRAPLLTPDQLRTEIQRLTADQLDQLVREMDSTRNVPTIFCNVLVQRAIEDRIAVADATREQWRTLQRLIETVPPSVSSPALLSPSHLPLPLPPDIASLPSSGNIAGDTDLREWARDHKGIIAATAGLAILGFFIIRYIAKKREEFAQEDRDDAERAGEDGAVPPEARKRSWFWKFLIPGAAIGIPSALAIKAYKNRKEITAKAKEGAEKTQKAVKESAEVQESIENARYGLVSAGLILLDRDLMPESTRFSDTQRRRILTGFLQDQRVQQIPINQVLNIDSEQDVGRVFGDVIANRPADERHVLFFLAKSCQKHQEYVTSKARRFGLSDEEIMQMPLIEYVDQLSEISSTFGTLTEDIATKLANKDIDIGNIDWKNVFNVPQFIHNLKTDRVFMRRIMDHYPELQTKENDFLKFCAANGGKTIHNLSQQLKNDIPEEQKKDWELFQGILGSMHQYIQDQTEYFLKYTHGEDRFANPLKSYLTNHLTVFDTIQLFYYVQQMLDRNGNFLALKDSPHFTAFLLQAKIISMVKHEDEDQGKRMLVNLTTRGVGSVAGAAMDIEIPEKAKELFSSAAGTIGSAAHKILTEAVHKVKIVYQETVRTAPTAGAVGTAAAFYLGQTRFGNYMDSWDIKWFARTKPEILATKYGISIDAAKDISNEASRRLTGKSGLQNYLRPEYESNIRSDIFKQIEKAQDDIGNTLKNLKFGQHLDDLQLQVRTHGNTLEAQLKGATNRAQTKQIMRTFNTTQQKIIDDGLDNFVKSSGISKTGAKTFEELAAREPHLAQAIGRGLRKTPFVTALGHKINVFQRGVSSAADGLKSRSKMFLPLLMLRALTSEEKIPVANLVGSTAIQLTPIAGTLYDVNTLITGKDRITGEEISRWQSAGFVAMGAATDTLTVLGAIFGFGVGGGVGIGARAAAFSARAGVKTVKAVKTTIKASEAMAKATRIAMKAEKIAKIARHARIGGYLWTIGNISYGLFAVDGEPPQQESHDELY